MVLKILKTLHSIDYSFVIKFIETIDLILSSEKEILEIMKESIKEIALNLESEEINKWLVVCLLRLVHDEDLERKYYGVLMLREIIELVDLEVCERFIMPDILAMIQSTEQNKLIALEIIPLFSKCLKSTEAINMIIDTFINLCNEPNLEIRKACVSCFKLFSSCEDPLQVQKLQPCFKEILKDKNEKLRHSALLQLGPIISSTNSPFPHPLLDMYLKLAKNASNDKELQANCAFYFPAVLEKMGKESWEVLSDSYVHLAIDGDFSSRKSIAASFHHISRILQEQATTEVYPLVLNYLENKQFRVIVMKNIPETLKNFEIESRVLVLKYLKNFTRDKNFRIRLMVAEKLGALSSLFKLDICFVEFWPICKTLCLDSIGVVRNSAMKGIGVCAYHIFMNAPEYSNELIKDLKKYASSSNSLHRIVFIAACEYLFELVEFEIAFGYDFKKMVYDNVAAVRILCARVARKAIGIYHNSYWKQIYDYLKIDSDSDVRAEIQGGENRDIEFIKADQSHKIIFPAVVRNKEKQTEFTEIWEVQSYGTEFMFLDKKVRPSYFGFVQNIFFDERT
jgi:hypothetical protein